MTPSQKPIRILAIGAHPDDLEFGVGGVLLKEHAAGSKIALVVTSKGESGSSGTPEQRVAEARAAAAFVGAEDQLTFLDFGGDGRQIASPENTTAIARIIRAFKPQIVLAPSLSANQHPDHAAVGAATRNACRIARYGGFADLTDLPAHAIGSLWFYSITPIADENLTGTILVDVSDVFSNWVEMMNCHGSQTSCRSYIDLQTSRSRQLGLAAGCEYAIALRPNDLPVVSNLHSLSHTARGF